ncbi:hypothetical protein B0A48_13078 [Cryoendolithus antarcticus]|uniref:Myb-like domain-containing protein n=1 Tax=Cryoendolithus antarcticus TaxID=1507870 RepID=A0A1V8SNJ3_9PEZI|nr:hypothetical protein B0A48_13078 [Cryoendolithus antarcticus]
MAGRLVTSLDYINRPNPVEPLPAPPAHHFHGSSSLHTQDPGRLLLDGLTRDLTGESNAKRRRIDGDGQARDLPKPPSRPGDSGKGRRTRLPPTLSGLYQPPPNSGLLPSIKVQQPPKQPSQTAGGAAGPVTPVPLPASEKAIVTPVQLNVPKDGRSARNKWSEQETADLLRGVAKFGVGSWTKILKSTDFHFDRRTALDLKDRFRVCYPEKYGTSLSAKGSSAHQSTISIKAASPVRSARSERKDATDLAKLGIEGDLPTTKRRSRHGYSQAEDEALLRGFAKHGKAWALILQDETFRPHQRKATDLRDRFRQRYPEEYAKSGLAARPPVFPPPPDRGLPPDHIAASRTAEDREALGTAPKSRDAPHVEPPHSLPLSHPKRPSVPDGVDSFSSLLQHEYDFFNNDELDAQPVVLGRGILDWALEPIKAKPTVHVRGNSNLWSHGSLQAHSSQAPFATFAPFDTNTGSTMLPSLATITASNDFDLQLELPSMNDYFNPLLSDGRIASSSYFPSLDELVGQN